MFEYRLNGKVYKAPHSGLLRGLSREEAADLEGSIRRRGIQSPILHDEEDNILDGVHRCMIAEKIGLTEVPTRLIAGLDAEAKEAIAYDVNDCRRHMTPHELGPRRKKRLEIQKVLVENPDLSDRAVAEKVGEATGEVTSHKVVGRVRDELGQSDGESSQLIDPPRRTGRDKRKRGRPKKSSTASNKPRAPRKPRKKAGERKNALPIVAATSLGEKLKPVRSSLVGAIAAIDQLSNVGGKEVLVAERIQGVGEVVSRAAQNIEEVLTWYRTL